MRKFILYCFLSSLIFSVQAQNNAEKVFEDLEKNNPAALSDQNQATLKLASRLFGDKNNLASVIVILPAGSVVDILDIDSTYLYVSYENYEGYISRNHAMAGNVTAVPDRTTNQYNNVQQTQPQSTIPSSAEKSQTTRNTYLENKYGYDIASELLKMKIWKGMTADMVLDSWGNPREINRVISGNDIKEEWLYNTSLLYIENDVLVNWQIHR